MTASSPGTSLSLLERLHDHRDADAWQKLVQLYTPLMHAWLRPTALQAADRDDLTQRILTVISRKASDFRHSGRAGAFRAWLRSITINVLHDYWRSRKTETAASSVLDQLADPASDFSHQWNREYNHHVVRGLLELVQAEFTPATMRAFRRMVLEEAPAATVAQELGISVNAVLIAKSRILARLRREGQGLID
jgi:RNA polymerase sigma-70 factor (ECF subfamily)